MLLIKQIYCGENNVCSAIPLEKRKVLKRTISKTIFVLFLGAVIYCATILPVYLVDFFMKSVPVTKTSHALTNPLRPFLTYVTGVVGPVILLVLAYILLVFIFQCFYYRYYFYDFGKDGIVIKKGVISRAEVTIAFSKIQNVFVDQDILDRFLGLYDVHIETAGLGSLRAAHIDGVSRENSDKLREIILSKISVKAGGDSI